MRMSCNGCRVLRKGCSDNCSIRPCLQWIKSPESQANATVFLAKFYGRAGLMNLINAGPEHLRPAIFRSLLYEACGRIVNPIYGSVGLLWSGSWQLCQAAVDAVLKGAPIVQISSESATSNPGPLKPYDIRHVAKGENAAALADLHKVKSRNRFKRSGKNRSKTDTSAVDPEAAAHSAEVCNLRWHRCYPNGLNRSSSESSSHSEANAEAETDSMFSNETVEASLLCLTDQERETKHEPSDEEEGFGVDGDVKLELTLGFEPVSRFDDDDGHEQQHRPPKEPEFQASLGLEISA